MTNETSPAQDASAAPPESQADPEPHAEQPQAKLSVEAGDGAVLDPGGETELWVGRTHWKHYMGRLLLWAAGSVAVVAFLWWLAARVEWLGPGGVFWWSAGIVALSGILIVGRVFLRIIGHRYRLTTQRLFIERGILSQTVDQTELIRVDDVRLYKSFLDRVFGLGSVAILSTDATDKEVVIEGIVESEKVGEAIRTRMRTMRRKSLFVENL
jgi:membrane protein YdbS with pleckstrin-like domain